MSETAVETKEKRQLKMLRLLDKVGMRLQETGFDRLLAAAPMRTMLAQMLGEGLLMVQGDGYVLTAAGQAAVTAAVK
jgi:hypothetical protein